MSKWVISDEVSSNGGHIVSKYAGLIDIPQFGWQYSACNELGCDWVDDNTLRITAYLDTISVSSRGGAAALHPQSMGVYEKTTLTWWGKPVWQSTVRDDSFLFYDGSKLKHGDNLS